MQRWWWATGSVGAGSRLATSDCKCSDLMFHHPMSSVEAGRGFVMASGRVGGSEGWEPLNTNPFGSPVVDAQLWRLPVHSVEKKSFSTCCNFKKLDPWWIALSKASWDENWVFSPLLDCWWKFGWCKSVLIGTWRLLRPVREPSLLACFCTSWMKWTVNPIRYQPREKIVRQLFPEEFLVLHCNVTRQRAISEKLA